MLILRSPGLFIIKQRHSSNIVTWKIFKKFCPSYPFHFSTLKQTISMIHFIFSLFIWNFSAHTSTRQPTARRLDIIYKNSESSQWQINCSDSSHTKPQAAFFLPFILWVCRPEGTCLGHAHITSLSHWNFLTRACGRSTAAAFQLKTENTDMNVNKQVNTSPIGSEKH